MIPLPLLAVILAAQPADPPATAANIAAALRLTQSAAAEYAIHTDGDKKPLELVKEPVLRWSNPDRGEVHGNVFVWTRSGRPAAVGSLYQWFHPKTEMAHEFHSLAEGPLRATFHGRPTWQTADAGVTFADIPGSPRPAATDAARQVQMRQLAKEFAGHKREWNAPEDVALRLLPQPIHRYADPKGGVSAGGLFALVHGTDPEIWLLIEARGETPAAARWQYAVARMSWGELRLRHHEQTVWRAERKPDREFRDPRQPYVTTSFDTIPEFLREAAGPAKK